LACGQKAAQGLPSRVGLEISGNVLRFGGGRSLLKRWRRRRHSDGHQVVTQGSSKPMTLRS
ncbi:MAG: hypothetical protein EBX62_04350, partial [Betaproteobacteria bacterium]|nr:hypothetical protein [Betaproteobacteria bacterium]